MVNKKNTAETADRHQKLIILAAFLAALQYATSAATKLVAENIGFYTKILEIAFIVSAIGIVVYIAVWKFRNLTKEERQIYFAPDGYLFSVVKHSLSRSWVATFIFMSFLAPFSRRFPPDLTKHFYIEVTLAFMLGSFSIIFFILDRRDNVDDS